MAIDKYTRSKFYDRNLINGINENDLVMNKFNEFKFTRRYTFYEVRSDDIQRPDLISLRVYGRTNFWWIIMKVNGIEDVWNDIETGRLLAIPNISDIEEYVLKNRSK
jgi:hypothetical protein